MTRGAWSVALLVVAATLVGSAWVYGRLPEQVPIHWNIHGVADGYGSRAVGAFLLPAVLLGLLGLFAVIPWASPASFRPDASRTAYGTIVVVALGMLAFVHALALRASLGYPTDIARLAPAVVLLGLGLMGNVFGRVQRNYFVGIRVPWTLASERVWNETHRLAAWITTPCGLLGSVVALMGFPRVALGFLVPIIAVPIAFSFVRLKQLEARGEA